MSFCFVILWFFRTWLVAVLCQDLAMMWLFISSSLFSILCFSQAFPRKSFHFSTFALSDQLSCLYPVFVATVAPHYCAHPHGAVGRGMITATASGAEAAGLWALHPQGMGSRVGWSTGPRTAKNLSSPLSLVVGLNSESHLHLWQKTFLSRCRSSCPPDKGHRIHLHRQTGQAEASQRHHCMGIRMPLSALQWVWVHIKFIPVSTSWAALEHALKVLLQQVRWIGGRYGLEPCLCDTAKSQWSWTPETTG